MQLKYKKIRIVLATIRRGQPLHVACATAKIDPSTFWRWRKAEERLDTITRNIIESRIQVVEDSLFKSCINGQVAAQIFYLTNRAPERWADRRAVVNNTQILSNVDAKLDVSKMRDEELDNIVRGLLNKTR